ncbi:MAG: hypothetical protein HY340_01020 [Candidatus Kerfeldbacteria bacterium]|nr:hypothetical protein [Candidatus Kerfeldbacteria bacterium]
MASQPSARLPSTRAYIWATVVLLIVLAISLILYLLGSGSSPLTDTAGNTNTPSSNTAAVADGVATPPVAPEPERILSRSGTVVRVAGNAIQFSSPVYNQTRRIYEEKELTARVTADTAFLEIDRTTLIVPPAPGQPSQMPPTKRIARSDIRIGDVVDVAAGVNIKAETEFDAVEIQKILIR